MNRYTFEKCGRTTWKLRAICSRALFLIPFFASTGWSDTYACMMSYPLNFLTFGKTDLVQSVKILSYRVVQVPSKLPDQPAPIGVFLLEAIPRKQNDASIDSTVRGVFTAYWRNISFQFPESWPGTTDVIVGLEVETMPDGTPTIFIAEELCSVPAIVADTPKNRAKIRAAQNAISSLLTRCPSISPLTGNPPTDPECTGGPAK